MGPPRRRLHNLLCFWLEACRTDHRCPWEDYERTVQNATVSRARDAKNPKSDQPISVDYRYYETYTISAAQT